MGRRKLPRGKVREVITISIPKDLIKQFDAKFKGIRSRAIERLMRNALFDEGQTKLLGPSYLYACRTCEFEGRSANNSLTYCRSCQDVTLYVKSKEDFEEEEE